MFRSTSHALVGGAALLAALGGLVTPAAAQDPATGALVTGKIDLIQVDDPTDPWSGGSMVVAGQLVIVPRNLICNLPANFLSIQQLLADAPPAAQNKGVTGLATLDGLEFPGGFATVLGNRTSFGNLIAGEIYIDKGVDAVNGTVTYVDYTNGYLRINGVIGDDTTGTMIRINDPDSRFTIQQGPGCDGGPNCSPDIRFGVDSDNYTITFSTGYPAGIPSTIPVGLRPGFTAGDDPSAASDANGVGDPFCPATNRSQVPVPDSTRFAPIQIGDNLNAEGNYEIVNGVRFLSCHTMMVNDALITIDSPTQPDYMIFDEAEWDVPAFDNQRVRALMIGFTTLNTSQLDIFRLHIDPTNNENHEIPFASTVGNPQTINQGLAPGTGGIFKIVYDVDFIALIQAGRSPCQNLINAGFGSQCPRGGTLAENIGVVVPITREVIGRTRHKGELLPGVITRDINGLESPNGQYLTPVGIGHMEFVEINLDALQTPFSFDGLPWGNDRRMWPGACDGPCESTPQPLEPFPWSGRDPGALLPAGTRSQIFEFFPFGTANIQAWPPVRPGPIAIAPVPQPIDLGALLTPPSADFGVSNSSGTAPFTVSFSDLSTGDVRAWVWEFGDGTFSTAANPVHTYDAAGTYDVTLRALGLGGESALTRTGLLQVNDPVGSSPPSASFTADATAGNAPLTVNFSDASTGEVTSWLWSFGDGSSSTLQNPSHTYTVGGLYSVSLTATGPGGNDTSVQSNLISVVEPGGLEVDFIAVDPTTGPAPLRVRFRAINVTGIATSGVFDFGDGTTATISAGNGRVRHDYTVPGVYTVTLTATDGTNTAIAQKVDFVTVTAPLTAGSTPQAAGTGTPR
jgi:PKD repeat protein